MPPRSLTVDESLLRRMARDAAIYSLTRPVAIVMWVALAGALTLSILNQSTPRAPGQEPPFGAGWMPTIVLGLAAYAVVMSVATARRAVRTAMPVETVVWVTVDDDALKLGSGDRRSDIAYATFQNMRVGKDAVLLKVRGASVATAIPRALLTDEDIAALRSRIS
ncbi:YcxB family protein [Microbacterium sp. Se5.02b]|uniref:YcxB family protein n=1 Tax=Microbacterium sp. Se5.02b TaxID=2864103 RepID=UPI001C69282A|nr:YcxB family protein [Microbacterium sp. Se5.02b]QYM65513.1 YcxB family protein [Microbacterium sp. Se5.02b]